MESFLKLLLLSRHGLFAYASIFSVLVACGLGVPLPEDVSLILGGFLAREGAVVLPFMMGVGFLGILAGDSLIFFAGRRLGNQVSTGTGLLSRVVTPEKRARVEGLFRRHGEKIVMSARFAPGLRAVTYFTAGSAGMKYGRFIAFDACAALASAPLFVWLGFRFAFQLELLVHKVKEFQVGVFVTLGVLVGISFMARRRRAAKRRAAAAVVVGSSDAPGAAGAQERLTRRKAADVAAITARTPRSFEVAD